MQIKSACLEDIPGVLVLLQANHISNLSELEKKNGFVTTNMTDQQFVMLIHLGKPPKYLIPSGGSPVDCMIQADCFRDAWKLFINY